MKKQIIAVVTSCLLLAGCSNVSQKDYNSVVAERDALKSQNTSLNSEINSLESDCNSLTAENKSYKEENEKLKKQTNSAESSENSDTTTSIPNTKGIYDYKTVLAGCDDFMINSKTSNCWYYYDDMFFSYIDANEFSYKTDDEIVEDVSKDMSYCMSRHLDQILPLWVFYICKQDGEAVAMGMSVFSDLDGDGEKNLKSNLKWYGEYERLNSNSKQIELFGNNE